MGEGTSEGGLGMGSEMGGEKWVGSLASVNIPEKATPMVYPRLPPQHLPLVQTCLWRWRWGGGGGRREGDLVTGSGKGERNR